MFGSFSRIWKKTWRRMTQGGILSWGWWVSLIPVWLTPAFWWAVLLFPFQWFFAAWHDRRLKNLIWGLPTVVMVFVLALVFHRIRQQTVGLGQLYWDAGRAALVVKDYARAEMLLDRILQHNGSHVEDARYGLATVFEETGNLERAESLFNALAPDNKRGYRDAHRRLAMILSETINEQSSEEQIGRLKWHLDASVDEQSARMCLAWGRYAIAQRDLEAARKYLEVAAVEFPELWITLGEVNARLGNTAGALSSYEKASLFLAGRLEATKDDRLTRMDYATVLMRIGKLDEAKVVLEDGLRRDPEGDWKQLLAALYVNYHDLLSIQGGHQISELLGPIAQALDQEPNFGPALNRLMAYATAKVEGNVELKKVLARVVAEGKQPALAHLALGNVCWMEEDKEGAIFHFERSLSINPRLAVVMNNLAWLVSHDEKKPDFERALAMIDSALLEEPQNGSFLDTRGTIYMLMDKNKEALDDLEKSLQTVKDVAAVHAKLAALNEKLGRTEMAEQHKLLEQEIRAAAEKLKEGAAVPNPR
jgi:tetratricopeptide (TPR) repeat protein